MVVYFSGTGNSRYAAEALAKRLGDSTVSANDYIKGHRTADLYSESPYVFVAPTYAWRIPHIFSLYIENGKFLGNSSAYFVMTCGDDIGNAGAYLKELCEKKNLAYKGVAPLVMPENHVVLFTVTEKAESERIILAADEKIKQCSGFIKDGTDFPAEKISAIDRFKSSGVNTVFYSCFVKSKGFRVTDKCISCGMCEELCPLNNIRLVDGLPVYGDTCTHCLACISACPTEAIEYNKRTVGKTRYYNSRIPVIKD
ncbi:MAG: EFR1 family ferrodoxin [Oscillospiraceae bacterium]|nr:EFR1 family ferrodoxin [Oscillospiraceae bacterium]